MNRNAGIALVRQYQRRCHTELAFCGTSQHGLEEHQACQQASLARTLLPNLATMIHLLLVGGEFSLPFQAKLQLELLDFLFELLVF